MVGGTRESSSKARRTAKAASLGQTKTSTLARGLQASSMALEFSTVTKMGLKSRELGLWESASVGFAKSNPKSLRLRRNIDCEIVLTFFSKTFS